MNTPAVAARFALITVFNRCLVTATLLALVTFNVSAQIPGATDGSTPLGIAPGSPAGSYALSDFDHINLYNGNPDVRLPLLQVNGRGAAKMTMMASVQLEPWIVKYGAGGPYATHNWWSGLKPGYGPGVLQGRQAHGQYSTFCSQDNANHYNQTLTRLTFTTSDGTEYELRDQLLGGQPSTLPYPCAGHASRGTVFVTADGTAATFVSDATIYDKIHNNDPYPGAGSLIYPSGYLMLRDGVRYRIDNGLVTWMRDRNGNRLSFSYDANKRVTLITDSLNRQVTVSYANFTSVFYDQITYKGFGGATRYIKVWWSNLSSALRSDYPLPLKTVNDLFLLAYDASVYNPRLISAIELPDGRQYHFYYNYYGEVARVETPTGGAIEYDMDITPGSGVIDNGLDFYGIYRRLQKRRIYPNGGTGNAYSIETTYSLTTSPTGPDPTTVTVEQRDSSGALKAADKHYFYGIASDSLFQDAVVYPAWTYGREYKSEALDVNGVTVLRRADNAWQQRAPVSWWTGSASSAPPNDVRLSAVTNTLADSNQVSKQTITYDDTVPYNNQQDVYEYDYGVGGAPAYPTRHTHTDYVTINSVNGANYATDTNIHIRSLPSQQIVYAVNPANGAETWAAQTKYEYDRYDATANHAALVSRSNISGFDSGFTTGYTTRGNATQVDRWLNSSGSSLVSSWAQYDIAGNAVKAIDAKGNATIFDFSDRFGSPDDDARLNTPPTNPNWLNGQTTFAFATKVTNALGHDAYAQYDYFLGAPVNSEDANGIVSSIAYNDALDRPTQGIQARYKVGSGVTAARKQMTFVYDDTNRTITTTGDRDAFNDSILTGKSYYDGLGRTWRKAGYEGNTGGGNTWLITDMQFDALGRTWRGSNPFRLTAPDGTPGSVEWTTTDYDALSRALKITTPDGAHVDTAYSGNQVTVTDQAGKTRRSITDAIGRLTKVTEDPNGLNYDTTYLYDALGNLHKVTQGTQTRWFAYDSLSRLIRAKNPEQNTNSSLPPYTDPVTGGGGWSMAYTYDANSNLLTKTDPLNITTNYVYDALNRNTQTAYSSYPNGSFYVDRFYDGATNGKGRFWYDIAYNYRWEKPTDNLAYHHNKVNSYDPLGRPLNHEQNFLVLEGGSWQYKPFSLSRTYDLAGNVKTQNYPSGRTVNYGYDTGGRLNSFTGNLGGGASVNYATGTQYNAYGLTSRETYGTQTPLYLNLHYNNRLQMVDLRLGSNSSDEYDWSRGALIFYYGTNARNLWNPFANSADNNGNVLRQVNYAPLAGGGSVVPQLDDYNYDWLNRITSVSEQQQSQAGQWTSVFTQAFSYDRWGNRTIDVGATTPSIPGVTRKTLVVDTATNRMTSSDGCGMTYDAAGNQTYDCVGTHSYDSENRMTKAVQGGSNNYYFYDASGKRVRRILNGSQTWNGQETWFVYGFDGELVAEYTYNQVTAPLPSAPQKEYGYRGGKMLVVWDGAQAGDDALKWLVTDHLGSTRMEANKSGSLAGIRRHDYLPFGEELVASTGAQRSGVGYEPPASNVKQKFGSKERDGETGLDFFETRYFSNLQGRFTSPDEPFAGQNVDDPQSWNLYTYTLNNPLKYIDPDGRLPIVPHIPIHLIERIINARSGFGFRTTAEVRAETERRRAFLREQAKDMPLGSLISRNAQGQFHRVDIDNLDQGQVWAFYDQIQNGAVEQLSKEQTEKLKDLLDNVQVGAQGPHEQKKPGKLGQRKGTDALRAENKKVADVVRELGLTKDQKQMLHDEIRGQNLTYHEIKEVARSLFEK